MIPGTEIWLWGKDQLFWDPLEILDLVTLVLTSEEKKNIKPKHYEEENSIENYLV